MKDPASVQYIALVSIKRRNRIAATDGAFPIIMTRISLFGHHGETPVWKNWLHFLQRFIYDKN